ncbi:MULTISPECIES: multidrug effflux MFS transporter [Staphylococcus]|uniref:multidrug effflux MFS transporter n=1 Tax=Staphylococcus TaxID=1279 RepID=UPI00122E703E|nr:MULTISPECIES: multidrug effflux MFS transporter [Staphylococcus]KAA2277856.1 multidrug effflux MFS transporter [Staphylococcus sp. GDX7P312P]KAA2279693.1 multidrug effflux MFS transporter [Staphylococcus sp. GDX7P459A]MDT0724134.1 multidrug effflux MFS transporter [Staphylococcus haemolyticus]MEB5793739.1 multidrug effflux MFS transporter [Staphylococcus hominis]MEB6610455.1 multidrug effflux MFS transporter [Staphylococcus borealis]
MKKKNISPLFILIMAGLAAFGPLSIDMYLPALPEVKSMLNTSTAQVQMTLTFFMIGLAFGNITIGTLSDTFGRKNPLIFSLIVYILSSIVIAIAPHITIVLIFRFIQGFAGGAGIVLSRAIATDLYKGKELTQFLAMLMLVNGAAPVLAPMFGGIILNFLNFRILFWILALLSSLMLIGTHLKINETLPPQNRRQAHFKIIAEDFKLLLTRQSFVIPMIIQGFTFAMFFGYMAASPFIMQNIYGLSAQQYSYIFALTGLGLIFTAQITGRLVEHMNQHTLFRIYSAIQLVGTVITIIALTNHLTLWILLPSFILIVGPVAGIGTLGYAIAIEGQTRGIGSASSLVGLMQYLIGAITTPLVGLQGENSYTPYIIVISITMIIIVTFQIYHKVFIEIH